MLARNIKWYSKLTYIFEKSSLQIQQRFYIHLLTVSIKAQKFRFVEIIILGLFEKIKCFKKVVIGFDIAFVISLGAV